MAKARNLTVDLVQHLKSHTEDIRSIRWDVFEHLVAEFLASSGFTDVSLVGRDSSTSADISAFFVVPKIGTKLRYFIEVKQWQKKAGIRIIDEILGAMVGERDKHGWTVGMLVAPGGVSNFEKYTDRSEVERKGVHVKQKEDVLRWLEDYEPLNGGLWLPKPNRKTEANKSRHTTPAIAPR